MEAILAAAEQAFSRHGLDGASVRDVAARAGVTHALVHRYFGTKAELYKAVLARNEHVIRDAADGVDELTHAARLMAREGLTHHPDYLRLLVLSALGGLPFDRTIVSFGGTERLIELARAAATQRGQDAERDAPAETDRRLAIALAVALLLGWASMQPWLTKATGIDDLDAEATTAGVERAVTILLEGGLLAPDGGGEA
jgi:AcrR family transcriptional regulator